MKFCGKIFYRLSLKKKLNWNILLKEEIDFENID